MIKFVLQSAWTLGIGVGMFTFLINPVHSQTEFEPIFTQDKTKKAWVELTGTTFEAHTVTIYVSLTDGSKKNTVYKKIFDGKRDNFYATLIGWNQKENGLYFYLMVDGVGSVARYRGHPSLLFIDISKEKPRVKELVTYRGFESNFVTDISKDDQYIAYVTDNIVSEKTKKKPLLHVKNIKNNKEFRFSIPEKKYEALGEARISPDNRFVAYSIGASTVADDDYLKPSAIVVARIQKNSKPKIIHRFQQGEKGLVIKGWRSNNELLLGEIYEVNDKTTYSLSIEGKKFEKIIQ